MSSLVNMFRVELWKALRSRVPFWTAVGSLLMPFGIAFLIFASKNPEVAQQLGLVSAKADLMAYSATDWTTYLGLFGQIIAAGGFLLFVFAHSWVFGREFADGTVKDMLAVPVRRSTILLAKFIVTALWSAILTAEILLIGLVMGAIIKLPGDSLLPIAHGIVVIMITACLAVAVATPFAFLASAGRGYLLPIGCAVLTLMMTNVVAIAGWGEYFPWGVPGLYAIGKSPLTAPSYWIVLLTGLAGMIATYLWWKYADQNR